MSALKLYFVIPEPTAFISGGNIYNEKIVGALQSQNVSVSQIDLESFRRKYKEEDNAYYFLDTIFFDELINFIKIDVTFFQKKCYLIVHHLESLYPLDSQSSATIFKQKEWPLLRHFKGFLTTSEFTKSYLEQNKLKEKKYIVIPPAIDEKPILKKRNTQTINALLVANIIKRKGILEFLQTLKNDNIPELNISIIGSQAHEVDYFFECKQLIDNDLYLKNTVKIIGEVPAEEMPLHYQDANLFVSTAYMETYGMALQEAVFYRLPLLVLNGGNAGAHVKPNINGIVANTMEVLVNQLKKLQENKNNFNRLSEQAWQYRPYENYTWNHAATSLFKQLEINEKYSC